MKRICRALAGVALAAAFLLAGCQPTPDRDFVVSKGEGTLQNAIMATPVPFEAAYTVPEHYESTFTKGHFTAEFDAEVIAPPMEAYPVYRVKDAELTQELAERIVTGLVGDCQLVSATRPRTKAELTEEMLKQLTYWNMGGYSWEEGINSEEDLRAYYEAQIAAAPETAEDDLPIDRANLTDGFYAKIDTDGNGLYDRGISIFENYSYNGFTIWYYRLDEVLGFTPRSHYLQDKGGKEVTISEEEAREVAQEAVAKLGFEDFALQYCGWQTRLLDGSIPPEHRFIFSRMIGNTPSIYAPYPMGGNDENHYQDPLAPTWNTETIEVLIDDEGVLELSIEGLTEQVALLNESVELIPFEDIMERAGEQLYLLSPYREIIEERENRCSLYHVAAIKLRYIRIWEKDGGNQSFLLIPAWFFYYISQGGRIGEDGETTWEAANDLELDEGRMPHMMVNALDGSIISAETGY